MSDDIVGKVMDIAVDRERFCEIKEETVFLNFGEDYQKEYKIPLNELKEPIDLVYWMCHLSVKEGWMNPRRIRIFAQKVCKHRGWREYVG